jgi:uncharacterized protein (TIGR03083 family)
MSDFDDRESAAYDRVAALFGAVAPDLPVGAGGWTARDVLAHLCNVARRYTSVPRLGETVREVDTINAEELAALDGLPVSELLGKFARAFARYREAWVPMGEEHVWPFHGGGQLSTASLRANWLGEMTVHGYDVATAAGVGWPIGDADAADLLRLLRDVVPSYAEPTDPVAVALAATGAPEWALRIEPGGARTGPPDGPVDATLRGPGGAVVLYLYQRIDLAAAEAEGVRVDGDREAVVRLMRQLQKP